MSPAAVLDGFVGAHVVTALDDLGVWTALESVDLVERGPTLDELARECGASPTKLASLLRVCELLGFVDRRAGRLDLTVSGRRLVALRGYFRVAVGGFGEVFRNAGALSRGDRRFGVEVGQDAVSTASGCAQNRSFQQPILDRLFGELSFRSVADLGCGSGLRLIELARRKPQVLATGFDIDPDACELARKNVADAGLQDRVTIRQADVRELLSTGGSQGIPEADLVMSFFLFHHFLADDDLRPKTVGNLRRVFPTTRYFLLGDGFALPEGPREGLPVFSLAFDLFHQLTDVDLLPRDRYLGYLAEAGLRLERLVEFGHPQEWLMVAEPCGT